MLKADFHMHSKEDFHDKTLINYSAQDLIKHLAKLKFDIVSITHHNHVYFNKGLKDYAAKRGILLIPGAEPRIEGKDVLLVNTSNEDLRKLRVIDDLDKLDDSTLIIAPHPYFFLDCCLRDELIRKIKTFDAIEYSHYYAGPMLNPVFKFLNGNQKAAEVAKKYKKPLVGTSDGHKLYEFGTTYTDVDCDKTVDSFIDAIRKNKIKLQTKPMSAPLFARRTAGAIVKDGIIKRLRGIGNAPDVHVDKDLLASFSKSLNKP